MEKSILRGDDRLNFTVPVTEEELLSCIWSPSTPLSYLFDVLRGKSNSSLPAAISLPSASVLSWPAILPSCSSDLLGQETVVASSQFSKLKHYLKSSGGWLKVVEPPVSRLLAHGTNQKMYLPQFGFFFSEVDGMIFYMFFRKTITALTASSVVWLRINAEVCMIHWVFSLQNMVKDMPPPNKCSVRVVCIAPELWTENF